MISPTAWGARTTPQPSQNLVEPSWNPRRTMLEPSWNLTSGPPRTIPEPIWAETPKAFSCWGKKGTLTLTSLLEDLGEFIPTGSVCCFFHGGRSPTEGSPKANAANCEIFCSGASPLARLQMNGANPNTRDFERKLFWGNSPFGWESINLQTTTGKQRELRQGTPQHCQTDLTSPFRYPSSSISFASKSTAFCGVLSLDQPMLNPLAKEGWKLKLQKGLRILADFQSNGVSNCGTCQEWVPHFERNKTLAMPLALLFEYGTH